MVSTPFLSSSWSREIGMDLVLELHLENTVAPLPWLERGRVDPPAATHTPRAHTSQKWIEWVQASERRWDRELMIL